MAQITIEHEGEVSVYADHDIEQNKVQGSVDWVAGRVKELRKSGYELVGYPEVAMDDVDARGMRKYRAKAVMTNDKKKDQ